MEITKARKPVWLEENLNNPFRDWDGRDHIRIWNCIKKIRLRLITWNYMRYMTA
ncbi:hypothetical protein MHH93_00435 [Priestia sp. FSL H7-0729]